MYSISIYISELYFKQLHTFIIFFPKQQQTTIDTATKGTITSVEQAPARVCSFISPSLTRKIRRGNTARAGVPNTRKHQRRPQNAELYKKYLVVYLLAFNSSTISLHSSSTFKCNDTMDSKSLELKCPEDNIQDSVILFCHFNHGDRVYENTVCLQNMITVSFMFVILVGFVLVGGGGIRCGNAFCNKKN